MNTNYIRSLLTMYKNKSEYEIETALAIYEFMDKDVKDISDDEILKVYKLIHSQDEIFNDYIKEEIIKIKDEHDRSERIKEENNKKKMEEQKEKEQDYLEK